MSSDKKDEEMICGLTADEQGVLRRELRMLPDTMPPRAVWHRIREQAEAEGLIKQDYLRKPMSWYSGVGLAAAIVLAAVLVPVMMNSPSAPPAVTEPQNSQVSNSSQVNALQALMVESRQLESDLRSLPNEPRVIRAGTATTISDIKDRVAAIDYQLNDPDVQMTDEETEIFWRERVRLMKLLVRLRYAQAQRTAY
ncbi:MAG: hypothetical protein OEM64_09095 [Gammaproteobacteria bacterium]|nr:hypothetical protein [Gammaproteobacteria bacterium]MDH3416448.1 hypothetical protein [Gammaproteobacteria bacterium]